MRPPLDPILIHITPNFGIHWYGVLIITGVMLGALYAAWRAQQDGENPEHVWNGLVVAIILAIIGARLYHIFSEPRGGMMGWSYYRQHPIEALYIWQGGLGIYGAIAGGALGVLLYAWRARLRPLQWLDYGAPGLALGQAIGRWGNFINQELYGPPTNLPWGLIIDPEHRIAPYNDLTTYPPDTLFHPTFLYESLWCLLVFIALAVIAHKWKDRLLEGDIFLGYIIGYPLGRFFIEYLRPDAWMIGPIAAAQLFAILCVVGGVVLLVVRHVRAQATTPVAETAEAMPDLESSPEPEA
ncbi:MAG: prolipoprotein diacylglyceryl transferase [Chloroflexi bacterium]|nr:MAG: prolipoprotein diacylglyceryl transferase [Chloroflexota bacterium]RLC87047.1 MAG: prolipoprotein diacylglyceryl transferase [Chloroflexota bacterium]HEY67274.1 prolipoprotein diacylglyceryl transferase [Thermoflexia bacterium]